MSPHHRNGHQPATKRLPLEELHGYTNTPPGVRRQVKSIQSPRSAVPASSQQNLPHNESLEPNGSLAVRSSLSPSPEHKRVSQITSECSRDSKRNSAISTTSTNASGRKRKTFIGHWQLGKTIGRGGCSRVRIVRHRYRDQLGAVKIVTRSMAENTRAQSLANLIESAKGSPTYGAAGHRPLPHGLEREIAVMKLLEHPNIVRLYDVWENRNELYLIMEYVDGGELFHFVDMRKGLTEAESVFIFRQIVAALLYCHRLLICHRDLKPENILLNQKDLTVKLIDFGMAALQPEGRLLSTPCGSPHYAAPEVVSSKPYDGKQADVWSCGVILYVMLTGTTPYNYSPEGDIRSLFRDIAKANYWMPPDLSAEAQDLIRRIFVPNPKKRITMDEIWDHPLVHKYDEVFGLKGPQGSKSVAIGPVPKIDQWKVKRIQDIDREILRNMRTLWHSDPEQTLIQKLLNNDLNQEKLFYAALIKHREENLENYVGEDDASFSASDYHHSRPVRPDNDIPPVPSIQAARSQSQYSILNDEHLRPSRSSVAPTPSVSSYDPYRSSRYPIDVTINRSGTKSTRKAKVSHSLRHPNPMRIEMLKQAHRQSGNLSAHSLQRSARSKSSMPKTSTSRNSLSSSLWPSSPPVIATMRPSDLHKRGVSFGHLRKVSTTSALGTHESTRLTKFNTPPTLSKHSDPEHQQLIRQSLQRAVDLSPSAHADQRLKSRKERSTPSASSPDARRLTRLRTANTPARALRNEIRKHSAELEKACEEAFFRTSVGSSLTARTSITEQAASPYDTPPSSVSARGSGTLPRDFLPRPLPDVPRETPNTYLAKTLEETRNKLVAYRPDSTDTHLTPFDDIVRLLGTLVPEDGDDRGPSASSLSAMSPRSRLQHQQRAVSAPASASRTADLGGFLSLPIISEDDDDHDDIGPQRKVRENEVTTKGPQTSPGNATAPNWHRAVTAPVPREILAADRTVRVVQVSPPARLTDPAVVAPLNVRKRSGASTVGNAGADDGVRSASQQAPRKKLTLRTEPEALGRGEVGKANTVAEEPVESRKKLPSWLGRTRKDGDGPVVGAVAGPKRPTPAMEELDDRRARRGLRKSTPTSSNKENDSPVTAEPSSATSSEFPMGKTRFAKGRAEFKKWIGRIGRDKNESYIDSSYVSTSHSTEASDRPNALARPGATNPKSRHVDGDEDDDDRFPTSSSSSLATIAPGPSRPWFARFFNLKPASQILCFTLPRARARQELYLLLRAWQRHGVRDLRCHRVRDAGPTDNGTGKPPPHTVITARVDRRNSLAIKPVAFRVEVFVVLEHGRPAGLSIARFVQVRGAASALRRVLEVVDGVMRARGWLVTDEDKWRALKEVVDGC